MVKEILIYLVISALVLLIIKIVLSYKCTAEVEATVIGINERESRGRHGRRIMVYQPTFSYEWNGSQRTLTPAAWSSYSKYEIGERETLLIDPDNPDRFTYKNIMKEPVFKLTFTVLTAVFVISLARFAGK